MSDAIIISLVSLVSSVLAGFGVKWYELRKKHQLEKKHAEHRDRLHNILVVYRAMEDMISKGYADRAILFMGSNGGARPRVGHPYQVTAVHAVSNHQVAEGIMEKFKVVTVDAQYVELLIRLLDSKDHVYYEDTSVMPEGRLKEIYMGEGIKSALICYLGHSQKELFYCSFSNYDGPVLNKKTKPVLALATDAIRHSFSLYDINN